jgi:hypothetical protein
MNTSFDKSHSVVLLLVLCGAAVCVIEIDVVARAVDLLALLALRGRPLAGVLCTIDAMANCVWRAGWGEHVRRGRVWLRACTWRLLSSARGVHARSKFPAPRKGPWDKTVGRLGGGNPARGTATDWVTRGDPCSAAPLLLFVGAAGRGCLMYSRTNASLRLCTLIEWAIRPLGRALPGAKLGH